MLYEKQIFVICYDGSKRIWSTTSHHQQLHTADGTDADTQNLGIGISSAIYVSKIAGLF